RDELLSALLVPLVGRFLAVARALGADARDVLRRVSLEDVVLGVRHLALRPAGRPALAETLHPAEESVHVRRVPAKPAANRSICSRMRPAARRFAFESAISSAL